jgi:hypothetical protein
MTARTKNSDLAGGPQKTYDLFNARWRRTGWLREQSGANLSLPASSEILRECREDRAIYLLIFRSFQ